MSRRLVSKTANEKYQNQSKILKAIKKNDFMTTSEIADELNISTRKAYSLCKDLEQKGFIWGEDPDGTGCTTGKGAPLTWYMVNH